MRTENNSSSPGGGLIGSALRAGLFAVLTAALLFGAPLGWASRSHFSRDGGGFARFQTQRSERRPGGGEMRARPQMRSGRQLRRGAPMRPGPGQQMRSGMGPSMRPGQEHLPAWWQAHRGLSSQQQADAMRREPGFRNLPPGQQQRLLNRLHNFDQRPPMQQQRTLDRMEMFERLSPERQQEVRGASQALSRMPPERQQLMRHAFQQLRNMPPEEREQMLHSAYGAQFTSQERTVLGNMLSIEPYQPHIIQPYFGR